MVEAPGTDSGLPAIRARRGLSGRGGRRPATLPPRPAVSGRALRRRS